MNVKLTSLAALILMVGCLLMRYVLSYRLGYYEKSYSALAYQDLLAFFGFIAFVYISIIWIISLFWKKHRLWTTGTMIGLLVLVGLGQLMPHSNDIIVYGLRDRLMHEQNLEDLRRFAQEIDRISRPRDNISGDTKSFMSEDLAKTGLKEKYPFLQWVKGPVFNGPSYVDERDSVVAVRWGGALSGHWGFNIAVNGGKLDLPTEPYTKVLPLSDDIFVIYEPD